jgi:hypothetical protein
MNLFLITKYIYLLIINKTKNVNLIIKLSISSITATLYYKQSEKSITILNIFQLLLHYLFNGFLINKFEFIKRFYYNNY